MAVIDTYVCRDDEHVYPALVDPARRWLGWVSPGFTIDAVRQLAAHTEEAANEYGRNNVDQIKVIEGGPVPVVLHIRWQILDHEPAANAVDVVPPDDDGRYWIGGGEWSWYIVEESHLFYSRQRAFNAWRGMLNATARRIGEVLRTQMPDVLAAIIDRRGCIHGVTDADAIHWVYGGYGPFDTETVGEAEELIRRALGFGRNPIDLEMGGWRRALDIAPDLHRLVFAPQDDEPAGGGPLEEAHDRFTEARRQFLNHSAPGLAAVCREAVPDATGVVASRTDPRRLLWFVTADEGPTVLIPGPETQRVTEKLTDAFAFEPTLEDLAACGWRPALGPVDEAHRLTFPSA